MNMQTLEYLRAAKMARRIDQPVPNLLKKIHSGELQPDAKQGRFFLFKIERLPEIQAMFPIKIKL